MFIRQAAVFSSLGPVRMGLTYGHLAGRVFHLASQSGGLRLVKAQLFKGGFVCPANDIALKRNVLSFTPLFSPAHAFRNHSWIYLTLPMSTHV
jgi:hypothetical protein